MKKIIFLAIAIFLFVGVKSQNKFIANPASVYVKFLGYKSEIRVDSLGNQKKVCVFPDGSECDEWFFYRGICGTKYSYCAIKGCETENFVDSLIHSSYAICRCKDSLGYQMKIPLLDFMEQNRDFLFERSSNPIKKEASY